MTFVPRDTSLFWQDGSKASYVACPKGQALTLSSLGGTLYYKSTSSVTSGSSDGNITTGNSATLTAGVFVICATGVTTQVFAQTTEGTDVDFRVGGNETIVGTTTLTGAVTQTDPTSAVAFVACDNPPATLTTGTDTAFASGTEFTSSIDVPTAMTVTNVGYLLGSVGGTDAVIGVLYDSTGAVLSNTTVAANGTTAGTAATFQDIALTSTKEIAAGRYYVGIRANGNTAKIRTNAAASALVNKGGYAQTNTVTHATVAAFTPAGTFTAAQGGYVRLS